MSKYLVRIEGVDFATTLTDTDDLSTIRGASQAYLFLPERIVEALGKDRGWTVDPIVPRGASIGIFRLTVPDDLGEGAVEEALADAIAAVPDGSDPLDKIRPHLSFTWAAVQESNDYGTDVYRLGARARARQLQRLTVDVPPEATALPCRFDRRRPGYEGDGRIRVGTTRQRASASVKARHDYGRTERHQFYEKELGPEWKDLLVTQSLQDIVDARRRELDPDDRLRLPVALSSKLAVVYFDGNKFTAIRETTVFGDPVPAGEKEARHIEFDRFVKKRRCELLERVLLRLTAGERNRVWRVDPAQPDIEIARLRFETLLWGGDEVLFVLPAWALMDVLPELMAALEGWDWKDGYTLSHAVGIAICNVKTPIAVARKLAQDIAENAKKLNTGDIRNLSNLVSIQVFESVEPPHEDLKEFRRDLYGTGAPRAFTVKGASEVNEMIDLVRRLQNDGLSRSQLYGVIADMREVEEGPDGADAKAQKLSSYAPPDGAKLIEAFKRSGHGDESAKIEAARLKTAALGFTEDAPRLPLLRLVELWDYVDPFGPPLDEPREAGR